MLLHDRALADKATSVMDNSAVDRIRVWFEHSEELTENVLCNSGANRPTARDWTGHVSCLFIRSINKSTLLSVVSLVV
jgi:hypothetical protein